MTPPEEKSASLRTAAYGPQPERLPKPVAPDGTPGDESAGSDPVIVEDPGKNNTIHRQAQEPTAFVQVFWNCPDPPRHEHDKRLAMKCCARPTYLNSTRASRCRRQSHDSTPYCIGCRVAALVRLRGARRRTRRSNDRPKDALPDGWVMQQLPPHPRRRRLLLCRNILYNKSGG